MAKTPTKYAAGKSANTAKTAAKKTAAKKTTPKSGMPHATAPIYNPIGSMTPAQIAAFPTADFVIVVQAPADNTTGPIFSTLAGAALKPIRTNLAGKTEVAANSSAAVQLMPKAGELLQVMYPDGTTSICYSRPRWVWVGLPVTQL